jgi:hypothetical protein
MTGKFRINYGATHQSTLEKSIFFCMNLMNSLLLSFVNTSTAAIILFDNRLPLPL